MSRTAFEWVTLKRRGRSFVASLPGERSGEVFDDLDDARAHAHDLAFRHDLIVYDIQGTRDEQRRNIEKSARKTKP